MPDLRESVVLTSEMFSPDHFTIVTSFMNNWTASFSPISSVPRTRSPTLSAVTRLWHTSVVTAPLRMLPRTRPSSHTCYACFSTILVNAQQRPIVGTASHGSEACSAGHQRVGWRGKSGEHGLGVTEP